VTAARTPLERRIAIIEACREQPHDRVELATALDTSPRTIGTDLRWLRARFPRQLRQHHDDDRRKRWHWPGPAPHRIADPPHWLTDEELLALVAARGLLRDPRGHGAERRDEPYPGLLDGALHGLLVRLGLAGTAADLAPEAVQVSRFAARAEDPATLDEVFRALLRGESLRFRYTNNANETKDVHCRPLRLINIAGEWHTVAWAPHDGDAAGGRLKQYRVSRIETAGRTVFPPPGCPDHIPQRDIDERFDEAFRATGSSDVAERKRVVLAVSARAWPHLADRSWGGNQRWDHAPKDLEPGWRRLAFTTTGLAECRHWVLGFGTALRAEGPPELVAWLREEAAGLIEAWSKTSQQDGNPACQGGR